MNKIRWSVVQTLPGRYVIFPQLVTNEQVLKVVLPNPVFPCIPQKLLNFNT